MGRKTKSMHQSPWTIAVGVLCGCFSCAMIYWVFVLVTSGGDQNPRIRLTSEGGDAGACCRGIEKLELWGDVVKSGIQLKFNTSGECCRACTDTCRDGVCRCNTWVFCGNEKACGSRFGECWLKRQGEVLTLKKHGFSAMWTSGILFGRGEGIIGMETTLGTIRIQLLPECSPRSVAFILELVKFRVCGDCHFHRGEGRGRFWDAEGRHVPNEGYGPPFAMIQGTLDGQGISLDIPEDDRRPTVERGSVAWVGSGPEFFISLADHSEWTSPQAVFGRVLREDMWIAEKISTLPTSFQEWKNVRVSVLENPVRILALKREDL